MLHILSKKCHTSVLLWLWQTTDFDFFLRGVWVSCFLSACLRSVWKWLGVEWSPLNGQKAPDRHPSPSKKCLSGPSDGQGPWGGHHHGWISCTAYSAQVFKCVWAVLILLNAFFWPRQTKRTDRWTDTHTRQNLYILTCNASCNKCQHNRAPG